MKHKIGTLIATTLSIKTMSSSKSFPLPLQERVSLHSNSKRFIDLLIVFLLFSLLAYRLASFRASGSPTLWFIAFVCESWFTFVWILTVNCKWSPITYKTYPDRLSKSYKEDLPAVDMFVTTADPTLEPPIVTVNTVLSLLAVEYPSHRLACYVSDDGGSPITYYALCEASKFAKLWVPFCKKYNIQVRAPFVYFSSELQSTETLSSDFLKDWKQMKGEYIELTRKIESGGRSYVARHMKDELADFSAIERGNHPSIIKVISENGDDGGIPHLIYVAREKRPKNPHHYKAGAMNVLTRVSGVMTNAPFILNVDCDMFANNPEVILHGMCLLLGFDEEVHSGYVQAPQKFYGALKDDPFGNQLVFLNKKLGSGVGGIQGPFYGGTGCFHRRKIIYGTSPESGEIHGHAALNDELSYEQPQRAYGNSKELMKSVKEIITKKPFEFSSTSELSTRIPTAKIVAACNYEFTTCWGKEIGWIYGSMTEDVLTGLQIQAKGWRSAYLDPDPPAFFGNAPTGGPAALTQYKRWATGLFEILFGPNSPFLATLYKKLSIRQCSVYLYINTWALCSVFEVCYALLPAYCFLADTTFLPKVSNPQFLIPVALLAIFNISTLADYLECGLSVRTWWNNQKMNRIYCASSFLFGFLSVVLKIMGLSETIFEVTRKGQNGPSDDSDEDPGRFTFDSSPFFVPGTALVLVHVAALVAGAAHSVAGRGHGWGIGELVCSAWVLASFWPFVRGLFGKGSYGIPWVIIWKAAALGSVFLQLCRMGRVN